MTSKERVYTALNHQEPDRVPTGEFATDYPMIEAVLYASKQVLRQVVFLFALKKSLYCRNLYM